MKLGWIKRTKAKVRSNARDHGRGEDAKIGEKRSDTGTRESLRSVDRVRVPASMKLNLIPASSRARSSEAEVGGGGRSGGPSPPQKRGCSQGRATDPTSCRIQPLILPITNSTTLSLLARFGLAIIPATFSLLQLRRQPNLSLPRASSNRSATPTRSLSRTESSNLATLPFVYPFTRGSRGRSFANVKRKEERERENSRASRHNRNETTKIRSQNHLGLLDRKKNDDAFAEVIVYKIYMSPVYGSIWASLCVIKEGRPMAQQIEEKPEGCQRGKRTRS